MWKSIGALIFLWGVSIILNDAFDSFERAAVATFDTVETAAVVSERQIVNQSH